jgi:hypothetical protein
VKTEFQLIYLEKGLLIRNVFLNTIKYKIMKSLCLIFLAALIGCSQQSVEPTAEIAGKVTIGPLCGTIPADDEVDVSLNDNPCGLSDNQLDDIYNKYTVTVTTSADKVIASQKLDHTGEYEFQVSFGEYILAVVPENPTLLTSFQKGELSELVTVSNGAPQYYLFNIDTGIR